MTLRRRMLGVLAVAASTMAIGLVVLSDVASAEPQEAPAPSNAQAVVTKTRVVPLVKTEVRQDDLDDVLRVPPPMQKATKRGKRVDFGRYEGY